MSIHKSISGLLYIIVAFITASVGVRFITATEFFDYHAEASGLSWEAVEPGLRIVYLAVFKVCGAAILAVSASLLIMLTFPFAKHRQRWSYYAIPLVGLLLWSIVFATTLDVSITTPGTAPWIGSLVCVAMILTAFVLSLLDRSASASPLP